MRKIGILFSIFIVILSPVIAQDLIYSGELSSNSSYAGVQKEGIEGFSPQYGFQSVSINISSSERQIDSLETYNSYRIDVKGNNVISMDLILDKTALGEWAEKEGLEIDDIAVLTEENAVMDIRSEGNYSSDIIITDKTAVISVVGSDEISEGYQLALSPDKTNCRIYWEPNSSYTAVDKCEGKIVTGKPFFGYNLWKIGLFVLSIILVSGLAFFLLRKKHEIEDERDIEEVTEDIIDEMENGDIPKDQDLLLKLQEANEKAYNNQYKEASKLLDEVKSKLETDIQL